MLSYCLKCRKNTGSNNPKTVRTKDEIKEIVNKILLAGDKCMPEMHLGQPKFTQSACRPFPKNKEQIIKLKGRGDSRYIYQNELDKACFQCGMAYGGFKDLNRRLFRIQ